MAGGRRGGWRFVAGLSAGLAAVGFVIVLAAAAVFVATNTDWGRERVRRFAEREINGAIHGRVRIGSLSGNLLRELTVRDVSITDSAGDPFVAADIVRARYSILSILRKRIWLDQATVVRPVVVLDRQPGGQWNWRRIFPKDTTPSSGKAGWGDWISFANATITDGRLVIRSPWRPRSTLSAAARDRAVRRALAGRERLVVERATGNGDNGSDGFQRVIRLESISLTVPRLLIEDPGIEHSIAQISRGSMVAHPFHPPAAVVRGLHGVVSFTSDSAWWTGLSVKLPRSTIKGDGMYNFDSDDLDLSVRADPATLGDLRWAMPELPPDARGRFDLEMTWRGHRSDYRFTRADLRLGAAHATGSFGITLDGSTVIHDTRGRFSNVDTRMLATIIPDFSLPWAGAFSGHGSLNGSVRSLAVDGDLTFDHARGGRSRAGVSGRFGIPDRGDAVTLSALRVEMRPVQVDLARAWMPSLPIGGEVRGTVTLDGASDRRLVARGTIHHRDLSLLSTLDGSVTVRLRGPTWFDVDAVAGPVSLAEVGRFAPNAGLRGWATGPVRLTGSLRDLRVAADLTLPGGGRVSTTGTFDLASRDVGYDLNVQSVNVDLERITNRAPATSLTAQVAAHGRGLDPATMESTIRADLGRSRWDTISVDTASVRANLGNGLARIERVYATGSRVTASASGTLGLSRAKTGTLTYHVAIDSLGVLDRWVPRLASTRTSIAPRPRVTARALQRAKADSARIDRATEMERMISGAPGPLLALRAPEAVPAAALAGTLRADGTVHGTIDAFDVRGRVSGDGIVARGNSIRRFEGEYAWLNVRTRRPTLTARIRAESLTVMGFALDTVRARVTYADSLGERAGRAAVHVVQDQEREYHVAGDYSLTVSRNRVRLDSLAFRFDSSHWILAQPSDVRWGPTGIAVSDLELRDRADGLIFASGVVPARGTADIRLDVENLPLSNISDLAQSSADLHGLLALHARMDGPVRAPTLASTFAVTGAAVNSTPAPDLRGRIGYGERALVAHANVLRRSGQSMATIDGHIPIDLTLVRVPGSRILSTPMSIDLVADSLPLELIPEATDAVSAVHGRAHGKLTVRGMLRDPSFTGRFALDRGAMTLAATGATFDHLAASIRMEGDTVHIDSIAATAKGPVRLRGTVAMANWREPTFKLFLTSSEAELLHNQRGRLRVDAGLSLTGQLGSAYLSGALTVTQGVIYIPESTGRHVISAGDPALFNVIDTATSGEVDLFPPESRLLSNLRVDVALVIRHNTWVRNREANIEIYTADPVTVHAEQEALSVTGVVTSDRGSYNFLSKRFQVKRGAATFVGSPDLNPNIQLTGEYPVELPSRGVLNIRVLIGGTLRKMTLSLESDAQPPRTQSELLSLLAFGQSATTLLATGSSSIAGSAATSDLFGVGAQVAARRLAGVALGVAANQVEREAGRALGTDVFYISPSDVPSGNIVGNLFMQTRFEAGKYVNPRTFVTAVQQAGRPGFGIEHRTADGWHFRASLSPRLLLGEPTLTSQPFRVIQVYGGFIVREWRF